ncbi:universal stress protein [Paraburkholderia sediminicola]|jgi:nucleotide-binding universal stress UspA family protein|uniref:universal stress protein n=1 Tax=Paraburkholderia sediminicola TaxID=458836 RepID=UPI0038B87736
MDGHILAAIDGSETSARAFDAALQLARESGAELQPLYVVDIPTMVYGAPATIRASPVLAGVSTRWRIWNGEKMLGQTARV